jgi:hypothetical protein
MFRKKTDDTPVTEKKKVPVKLIAILTAVAVLLGLLVSLLSGGIRTVAKKYVMAQIEGDAKAMYRLMAGDMRGYSESLYEKNKDEMFDAMEERCEDLGIRAKIRNFNQYYRFGKKASATQLEEQYHKGYQITLKVREVENMSYKEVDAFRANAATNMGDYIVANKIKDGKIVTVDVTIKGTTQTTEETVRVHLVKYKGKWKVAIA